MELLSAIEAELGVYMDEGQISPDTTVRQLEALVEEGSKNPPMVKFPDWGMQWWCRATRGFLQRAIIFPFITASYGLRVSGAREPVWYYRPSALCLQSQPRIGQPTDHQGRATQLAPAYGPWREQLSCGGTRCGGSSTLS